MVDRSRRISQSDSEILEAYQKLKSAAKVAKHFGIGGTTVERILKRHKVVRIGREHYLSNVKAYSPETEILIVKKYQNGAWASDLVKEYGGSIYSINQTLERFGVEKRQNPAPTLTDEELETIKRLHESGLGQTDISLLIGRSQTFVSGVMRKNGIQAHRPMKYTHGNWKGGRAKVGAII